MARSFLEAEGTRVKGLGRDEIATLDTPSLDT
jgi:hypothetical protein